MNKDVLYISSACSEKTFEHIEKIRKKYGTIYGMPVAANKFHNLIMKGLKENGANVDAIVGLPISSKTHSKKIWKKNTEKNNYATFTNLFFINIPVIKHICIGIGCFNNIIKWGKNKKNKLIIYDASYVSILLFVMLANRFTKAKTIAIFCDIYEYMYDVKNKNTNSNFLNKITRRIMKRIYNKTSGYVFLSEPMNELINKENKPHCIIEGIANTETVKLKKQNKKTDKLIYMYAGALKKEYGLEILLKGFTAHKNDNAELWICGLGAYAENIKEFAEKDKRIKFYGVKTNDEVIQLELQADILINPRPSNQEFTRYSFPSKLMEYMSTGTAVLTTKLSTIPKEYKKYLLFIEKESSKGISERFDQISKMKYSEIEKQGKSAQQFMKENKTEIEQTLKILNLLGDKNEY